jgi:hypothetical protein
LFDCSSFVYYAYEQAGIKLGERTSATTKTLRKKGTAVKGGLANARPGDMIFFDTYDKDGHVGIYLGDGKFIGAQSSTGVAVVDINKSDYWSSRFKGHVRRVADGGADGWQKTSPNTKIGSVIINNKGQGKAYSSAPSGVVGYINQASNQHKVNPNLVAAVIKAESNFKVNAQSHAGAGGLMQLMPATAKGLGVKDRFNPAQNVNGGTKYLRQMLEKYGNNRQLALAAYNAGPGNVDKAIKKAGSRDWSKVSKYLPKETRNYVPKVLSYL